MNSRTYRALLRAAPIAAALLASALSFATPAGAALSPSAYRVGALCSAPPLGYDGCLGLRLVAKQPRLVPGSRQSARATRSQSTHATRSTSAQVDQVEFEQPWEGSLSPQNVLTAYGLSAVPAPATSQTIALVDAFADPTAEHDLQVFDKQFGLPACTTANGCFDKVAIGSPESNAGWAQETATDIEVAHGMCPSCKILLVEAHSNFNVDLEAAEKEAEQLGATEISNSWGGPEQGVTAEEDRAGPFNHPDTVITAAAGDNGYLDWDAEESAERGFADYPASSPHVVAVGGTHLSLSTGGEWLGETAWNSNGAGGGGCSTTLSAPPWQRSLADWPAVGCETHRAVADVSADADPYSGVAVFDSTPVTEGKVEYHGWVTIGGTSVASPIIAATFALAGGAAKHAGGETVKYPAQTLYENLAANPATLHDVVSGSNGACANGFDEQTGLSECSPAEEDASCGATAICLARSGYDGPTGVGTPDGIAAFQSPAAKEGSAESKPGGQGESPAGSEGGSRPSEGEVEGESEGGSGGSPSGSGEEAANPGDGPPEAGEGGASPTGALSSAVVPVLSAPSLTRSASAALRRGPSKISLLAFTFTLNVAAHVRVTLAEQTLTHGHTRWRTLPYSPAITGAKGHDSARLHAQATLSPGRYRLTLTPLHGRARSLSFRVG